MTMTTRTPNYSKIHQTIERPIDSLVIAEWELLVARWKLEQTAQAFSARTIEERTRTLLHLAYYTGRAPREIVRSDLVEFMTRTSEKTGEPLSAGSKQVLRTILTIFFRWAKDQGDIDVNPALNLPKVKQPRWRPRPIRDDEISRTIERAYGQTRDFILLAALAGLRVSEIASMRGEHIHLETMTIRLRRKGGFDHEIPLHPALLELVDRRPKSGWWFPSRYPTKEYPEGGGHVRAKSVSDQIGRALRRAGITDRRITAHSLRHYYATELLRRGVSIRIVQEMLGHQSLATTERYTEVSRDQLTEAITHLEAPFVTTRPAQRTKKALAEGAA